MRVSWPSSRVLLPQRFRLENEFFPAERSVLSQRARRRQLRRARTGSMREVHQAGGRLFLWVARTGVFGDERRSVDILSAGRIERRCVCGLDEGGDELPDAGAIHLVTSVANGNETAIGQKLYCSFGDPRGS